MLYILPPPRAPDPPSPWDSILCTSSSTNANDKSQWADVKRNPGRPPPPRARFRNLKIIRDDDSSSGLPTDDDDANRTSSKSLSECYFAGKGAALVLPAAEAQRPPNLRTQSNIQKHLQSMFYLLRPEETLKMAVKLESVHIGRTRYLVVVSRPGKRSEESCLLGIDCNERTTVGLVLRVLADTAITLDGDGGFSVSVCGRHHIFKPVSVQAMWSALQTLHKVSLKAREQNYFQGGLSHDWVEYYEQRIESDRSCLNEWHAMDNLESRRPPSPGSVRTKPRERDETEKVIRDTLKEIMMSLDLDEVTSKYIRSRLEEDLDVDLGEFKPFIDQEIMTIFGQMDAPTEIFDHVYLGSEWNASNFEELQKNGVGHILNVTREIDNFFPGTFDYLNVRVYDDEKTDLLKYWDNTFKYITKAKKAGSKVLVHCKMGVSRSASVVIAYAMKAYDWDLQKALKHVKDKRNCIKPNNSFISQLETYQGMLDAMKNKEKLLRSKSETNLKSPGLVARNERVLAGSEPTPALQAAARDLNSPMTGQDLHNVGARPKSWSPENSLVHKLLDAKTPLFLSLENLNRKDAFYREPQKDRAADGSEKKEPNKDTSTRNVLMPFHNGQTYSVSANQIMHIPGKCLDSVKRRVNSLESKRCDDKKPDKKKLVLNVTSQFDGNCSSRASPDPEDLSSCCLGPEESSVVAKLAPKMLTAVLVKKEIWDPGDTDKTKTLGGVPPPHNNQVPDVCSKSVANVSVNKVTARRDGDHFSNQVDKVFDREERKQQRIATVPLLPQCVTELSNEESVRDCPSRQSSWSSYDSAVVLGYQGESRDAPSRHSSWGSGDTRTLPSRNSSWGSYDMRPGQTVSQTSERIDPNDFGSGSSGLFPYDKDDIPWYTGTVRRTKQKLEESSGTAKKTDEQDVNTVGDNDNDVTRATPSAIRSNAEYDIVSDIKTNLVKHNIGPRLSASAPECSPMDFMSCHRYVPLHSQSASNVSLIGKCNIRSSKSTGDNYDSANVIKTQLSSVKHVRNFLENLNSDNDKNSTKKQTDEQATSDSSEQNTLLGIVKNLKKEFEAKTTKDGLSTDATKSTKTTISLPPSPVNGTKEEPAVPPLNVDAVEDTSVRTLVGKYEEVSTDKEVQQDAVQLRPKIIQANRLLNSQNKFVRHSCFEVVGAEPKQRAQLITQLNKNTSVHEQSVCDGDFKRPPVPPNVVVATVIAKAAKKQQQYGKSHPLARLNIKPRHNNPVYNTM